MTPGERDSEISVVLPLTDDRGHGRESLESWIRGQTLASERFEVLVMCTGDKPQLEALAESMLRQSDRLMREPGASDVRLSDAGARTARSPLVLFTESHCVADPECLEELVRHFAESGDDGACCRSVGLSANAFARAENRQFQRLFREWSAEANWQKVFVRGFALNRAVYLESGGFDPEYGVFNERAFAAKLHATGRRLGYANRAIVRHVNSRSIAELDSAIEDFARGEWAYLEDHPADHGMHYVGVPREWSDRGALDAGSAQAACLVASRNLFRRSVWRVPAALRAMLGTLLRMGPTALAGSRARLFAANFSCAAVSARCLLWKFHEPRLDRAYRDVWERRIHRARLRLLNEENPGAALAPAHSFAIDQLPEERLFGFHWPERAERKVFRWSRSVAFADLPVTRGSYDVRIDTLGVRHPGFPPLCLWVFLNGRRLPARSLRFDERGVSFHVGAELFTQRLDQRLMLTCAPLEPWRYGRPDRRELGLPVAGIHFHATD